MKRIILALTVMVFAFSTSTFAMHSNMNNWYKPSKWVSGSSNLVSKSVSTSSCWLSKWEHRIWALTNMQKDTAFMKKLVAEPSAAKRMMMRKAYMHKMCMKMPH